MRPFLQPILTVLIAALLLPGCGGTEVQTETQTEPEAPRQIPVVDAQAVTALREKAAAEGKVLVIDCWATWCSSCVEMFPHLHKAIKERGDGVVLVSLGYDEGETSVLQAGEFLTEQGAWDNAYLTAEGSDAKDAITKALSETWDGGALPAVFVYKPDGTTAHEMLDLRGEVQDWVGEITAAVDASLPGAGGSPSQ